MPCRLSHQPLERLLAFDSEPPPSRRERIWIDAQQFRRTRRRRGILRQERARPANYTLAPEMLKIRAAERSLQQKSLTQLGLSIYDTTTNALITGSTGHALCPILPSELFCNASLHRFAASHPSLEPDPVRRSPIGDHHLDLKGFDPGGLVLTLERHSTTTSIRTPIVDATPHKHTRNRICRHSSYRVRFKIFAERPRQVLQNSFPIHNMVSLV